MKTAAPLPGSGAVAPTAQLARFPIAPASGTYPLAEPLMHELVRYYIQQRQLFEPAIALAKTKLMAVELMALLEAIPEVLDQVQEPDRTEVPGADA